MKGLWTKDIKLISSQQKSLLAIWLIAAGILITTDQISFAISYTSIITSMIGVSTITYDAFDNGNVFLFTLPFTRKEYAMEKYLFTLFLGAVATIGGILLVIVVMMAKGAFSVNAKLTHFSGNLSSSSIKIRRRKRKNRCDRSCDCYCCFSF